MAEKGSYIAVVGGINVDICGRSSAPLVPGDSNPGRVTMGMGGVGRNIAHNLLLLGERVKMLTALGDDSLAREVELSCGEIGLDITHARRLSGAATSTYLYISDSKGEMALAVNDMELCNAITPAYLRENLPLLQNAKAVVADANIPAETLRFLWENCRASLFVDPVSTVKAKKLEPILNGIYALKPNRLEAEILAGIPISDEESLYRAADILLKKGVRQIYISLGNRGVLAAEEGKAERISCCPAQIRNTTGAGDAFMAALVAAHCKGKSFTESAKYASVAAAIAAEGENTINPDLSTMAIESRLHFIKTKEETA